MASPALVRFLVGVVASLATLRLGTGLYAWRAAEALERPNFKLLARLSDGVEIRHYEPYLIAETTVDGVGFREPAKDGFRACASYIFGRNKKAAKGLTGWFSSSSAASFPPFSTTSTKTSPDGETEKMAMTAPVRVTGEAPHNLGSGSRGQQGEPKALKKTKVSFVIGKKYSLKTAPIPLDKKVKVRQVPSHTLAVKSFSGPPPNDQRVQKERLNIEKALALDGRNVPGPEKETIVYGYHDPFITPNFLRRNEVALLVEGSI